MTIEIPVGLVALGLLCFTVLIGIITVCILETIKSVSENRK